MVTVSLIIAGCSAAPEQADVGNATTAMPMPSNGAMPMGMAANPGDPPATQGYKKSMSDMMANMPTYTGDADADFMRQMKVHHGSAIAMAQVELNHGKDAKARALAEKIIGDQRAEIAQIDAWLAARK
ncbi:DUF305 domain-containing protein [Sphingomonas spermidinifaciens]|uniref:DUF305 domain-containing protein n=1 Tax=Sphingomonas spermidinifaciens TaxID=1141889 RepID=A0A2A4B435_9SPHN|nr:DUF305 domain-containing protein [Sphingomonas spermidinifaciens]